MAESSAFVDSLHLDQLRVAAGVRVYMVTVLARAAVRDGMVTPDDDLLFPRFCLTSGLNYPAAPPA